MGSIFSKDKDKGKKDAVRKPGSAPSRLEGLDGTTPPRPDNKPRALTPDSASRSKGVAPISVGGPADSPSPASTTSPGDLQPKPSTAPAAPAAYGNEEPASPGAGTPTRRAPKKIDYVGAQSDGAKLAADLPAAVQVPDEAMAWIPVLGESVVRSLHSPDWKTREHAIQAVSRSMGNAKWNAERAPEDVWLTVSQLLDKSLKDKVAPLFHASLELLATMVATYSQQLPYSVLTQGLEPLMPTLLHRVGNNNARIQETSIQALLTFANQPALGLAFLAPHALSPIPKKSQTGAAAATQMAGRLELITCMLNVQAQQQMGFGTAGRTAAASAAAGSSKDALSAEEIIKFTRPALEMPDDKVRTGAVRLVAEVYRARKSAGLPFEVDKMLGPGMKPALLQVLHRRFAEVDEELNGGGGPGAGRAVGSAGRSTALEDMPVGPGISIKASGNFKGGALPPISGRGGTLPALAVVGSRGGSRPGSSLIGPSFGGAGGEPGKPPRTPTSPARGRTPPRGGRMGSAGGADGGSMPSTPLRNVASPMRGGTAGTAPLPGFMPDGEGGADVMMIHSGTSTPVRGSNTQGVRNQGSLKAKGRGASGGSHPPGSAGGANGTLDDAEEQLIEYILNDEARAGK